MGQKPSSSNVSNPGRLLPTLNWALLGNGKSLAPRKPEQPIKFQYRTTHARRKQEHQVLPSNHTDSSDETKTSKSKSAGKLKIEQNFIEKRERRKHKRNVKTRREELSNVIPQFGYEIQDIDGFLTKATLDKPANIPVVLSFPSVLYQTRIGGYQAEIALPLGMVVNAVFKNQHWLYVQTPHAEEGYVSYTACIPLGIIPTVETSPTTSPCWEHCSDVFPKPSGNQTDTDKMSCHSSSNATDSDKSSFTDDNCNKLSNESGSSDVTCPITGVGEVIVARRRRSSNKGSRRRDRYKGGQRREAVSVCGERSVDRLYLRATANNKRLQQLKQQLAQHNLKIINHHETMSPNHTNHLPVTTPNNVATNAELTYTNTNANNDLTRLQMSQNHNNNNTISGNTALYATGQVGPMSHDNNSEGSKRTSVGQMTSSCTLDTLLVVRCDYQPSGDVAMNDSVLTVARGEVVTLLAVARQPASGWFWVRTRAGNEGFIPAAIVGHGFL